MSSLASKTYSSESQDLMGLIYGSRRYAVSTAAGHLARARVCVCVRGFFARIIFARIIHGTHRLHFHRDRAQKRALTSVLEVCLTLRALSTLHLLRSALASPS